MSIIVESCYKSWLLLIFCPKFIIFPRGKNCHLFVCLPVFLILITHSNPNFADSLKLSPRCSESSGFLAVCVSWRHLLWLSGLLQCGLVALYSGFTDVTLRRWPIHYHLNIPLGSPGPWTPCLLSWVTPSFWWSTSSGAELWEVNCLKQIMSKNIITLAFHLIDSWPRI